MSLPPKVPRFACSCARHSPGSAPAARFGAAAYIAVASTVLDLRAPTSAIPPAEGIADWHAKRGRTVK